MLVDPRKYRVMSAAAVMPVAAIFVAMLVLAAGCTKASVPERRPAAPIDPVIAATLDLASTKGTPAVSGEIHGYIMDWIIDPPGDERGPIHEAIVLKDGSIWHRKVGVMRPSAAFGRPPQKRIGPETTTEATTRINASTLATKELSREHPRFANVKPQVYGYIVRIRFADGSTRDAWVNPGLDNKSIRYDVRLVEWRGKK